MENTKRHLWLLKVYTLCSLSMLFLLITASLTNAQIFTFDYLTYTDYAEISGHNKYPKGKATALTFFGVNEFDSSGNASADNISYTEFYLYLALRVILTSRVQMSIAPQIGLLAAEGLSSGMYGAPWIWVKYMPFKNLGLAFRFGFQFGRFGKSFWLKDNKIDVGILASKFIGPFLIDGTLSYRFRQKSKQDLLDFQGLFNEAGNEMHYKLQGTLIRDRPFSLALIAFGYISGDKKLDGQTLPDSYSRKTSVGISFRINTKKERFFVLSLLYDVIGRYDKKGFSIVLNIAD